MNDSLKIAGGLMFLTAILAIVAAMVWPDKEPAIVPINTVRVVHPAQFWDEGKVYVTVNWLHSNEVIAWQFRLTNTLDEVMAWMQPRSDLPFFWIESKGTNAIELKGIVP